jgi:hypothetical protein
MHENEEGEESECEKRKKGEGGNVKSLKTFIALALPRRSKNEIKSRKLTLPIPFLLPFTEHRKPAIAAI